MAGRLAARLQATTLARMRRSLRAATVNRQRPTRQSAGASGIRDSSLGRERTAALCRAQHVIGADIVSRWSLGDTRRETAPSGPRTTQQLRCQLGHHVVAGGGRRSSKKMPVSRYSIMARQIHGQKFWRMPNMLDADFGRLSNPAHVNATARPSPPGRPAASGCHLMSAASWRRRASCRRPYRQAREDTVGLEVVEYTSAEGDIGAKARDRVILCRASIRAQR